MSECSSAGGCQTGKLGAAVRDLGLSQSWVTEAYLNFMTFKVIVQCPVGGSQNIFKFACEESEILKNFDRTQLLDLRISRTKTKTDLCVQILSFLLVYAAPS